MFRTLKILSAHVIRFYQSGMNVLEGVSYQYPTGCCLGGRVEGKGGNQSVFNWLLVWWVKRGYSASIQLVAGWVCMWGEESPTNIHLFAVLVVGKRVF